MRGPRSGRPPEALAGDFAGELAEACGDRLVGAVLYGSVPRGEWIEGVSDINVLVLVDEIRVAEIGRFAALARRWVGESRIDPMIVRASELPRSGDAFAVEIADMRDHRLVLAGEDPIEGIAIDRVALRSQVEHELRGKLAQLYQALMLAGPDPAAVGSIVTRGLPSFATYLRAALRLARHDVPDSTPEAVAAVAVLVGGDPTGFLEILRRRTEGVAEIALDDPAVEGYANLIRRTLSYVDSYQEGTDR